MQRRSGAISSLAVNSRLTNFIIAGRTARASSSSPVRVAKATSSGASKSSGGSTSTEKLWKTLAGNGQLSIISRC